MGFSSLLVVPVHGANTDCFVNVRDWSLRRRSGIEKLEEVDTKNLFVLQKNSPHFVDSARKLVDEVDAHFFAFSWWR